MAIRSQPLAMGLKQITGLADGVEPEDAVNKGQLDAAIATAVSDGSITTEKLADEAVTLAKLDPADFASQAEAEAGTDSAKLMTPLRVKQFHDAQPAPVQRLIASYVDTLNTVTAVSAVIPYDNTTPLVTEGTQIFSRSVTTTSATQIINVLFISSFSLNGTSNTLAAALFNGSTLIGVGCNFGGTATSGYTLTAAASVAPGAAGTYTISARVGPGSAGTFNLNAAGYGGGASTVMIVQVIEP